MHLLKLTSSLIFSIAKWYRLIWTETAYFDFACFDAACVHRSGKEDPLYSI